MNNYPPGMRESDIPGIDDKEIPYVASFRLIGEGINGFQEAVDYIKAYEAVVSIDISSFKENEGLFEISFDVHGMINVNKYDTPDDIEHMIIKDIPTNLWNECEYMGYELK